MRGKLLFITGGLVGYVLGARAGRKRYEQIASTANSVWNAQPVQRRVNEVRDFALELVGDVPSVLLTAGKKVVNKATSPKAAATKPAKPATPDKAPRPTPTTSFPAAQFPPDEADLPSTN
ncbi:YtxH domain-containing protein [Cryobacterium melibiosiphilum]|uniref:YtxH domain-containing protein n=1 Tax=Cryobacterium melibiosiphilum TaxID=995039 RepID=A0A3A5MLD1_9MICO|nr:YtxH domain-containing protein [Cryobacterium melibiosiphilum]RJT87908.1 YtxH domain-containing protein [Cryobacterium melibiosiphilum]